LSSIVRHIANEVKKLLNSQVKLSQASFEALESRVATEVYLREKKDAILKDREEGGTDDAVSHLSKVQQKASQAFRQNGDARSQANSYRSGLIAPSQAEVRSVVASPQSIAAPSDACADDWVLLE
jgi:hypothetical protein